MMKIADTRMRSRIVDLGPGMVLTLFDRAAPNSIVSQAAARISHSD